MIYLLRLDATERAQKILTLAIVHAHHLGIHLSQTYVDMPTSRSELFQRVWWCIYVLDRRIALVLGLPFVIHDNNIKIDVNKGLGINKSLEAITHNSSGDLQESHGSQISPLHYLSVMVGYSKVVGKVWETLFGAESSEHANTHIHEYLDCLVQGWLDSIPPLLICDVDDIHRSPVPLPRAVFKQRFLVRLVSTVAYEINIDLTENSAI